MHAYIAGPLFNEGERQFDELLDECARAVGMTTYLPHRDGGELAEVKDTARIFALDVEQLERADIVIANLNGVAVDDGTAWELGYAYARGKRLVGVHTDMRIHAPEAELNVMILESLDRLCHSVEELREYLKQYQQTESGAG